MSVIKLLDENGNIIDIPSLKGDDGKLAYEYAKEGGYTGTRDEFLNDLTSISSNFNNHLEDDVSHIDLRNECENLTPSINTGDENKILRVVDGNWSKVDDVIIPRPVLTNLADAVRSKIKNESTLVNLISNRSKLTSIVLPDNTTTVKSYAFSGCTNLNNVIIPASVSEVGFFAFNNCTGLVSVTFKGKGTPYMDSSIFVNCPNLKIINVPWSENDGVSGAPWGATNATINYNYTG